MTLTETQQLIVLFGGLAVAYLICLRLILSPRRTIRPEYPFVGTVLLFLLCSPADHLFKTFGLPDYFTLGAGVLLFGTGAIVIKKDFRLLKVGFGRGILWFLKLAGIFLVVDFLLFYLTDIRIITQFRPEWYSFISDICEKLDLDSVSYHIFMEDKAWYEWAIAIDCGLSAISFLEGIPAGLHLIRPRLPVLPTLIVILVQQLCTKKRTLYCAKCEKNLTYRDLVHFCPVCHKISTIKLMNPLGTVYVECENELCNAGKRKKFSRINPLSKRAVQGGKHPDRIRRIRCKACSSLLSIGNAFVTLSLFSDSTDLIRDFRYEFVSSTLDPSKMSLSDPNRSRISCRAEQDVIRTLETICSNGNARRNIPLSPLYVTLNYKNKSLNNAILSLRTAVKDQDTNRLTAADGIILLLGAKSRPTERQAAAESLAMELDRLNTEAGAWKNPVLVGICADGSAELTEAIRNGFSDYADMERQCMEYLESQSNDEIVSTLDTVIANVHYFIYAVKLDTEGTETSYNIIPPVQALLSRKLPAMKRQWTCTANGILPAVSGKYRAK
ncbi:MAG: hypothetical protein IK130_11070 [Oscillospiraceae bacterium]|nr:hypothetical protein [Oscillospiraceae bacterium]